MDALDKPKKGKYKIIRVKEIQRRNGESYFNGVLAIKKMRLSFMFDPGKKELYIFEWQEVSPADTRKIHRYLCNNFKKGMKIKKSYNVA